MFLMGLRSALYRSFAVIERWDDWESSDWSNRVLLPIGSRAGDSFFLTQKSLTENVGEFCSSGYWGNDSYLSMCCWTFCWVGNDYKVNIYGNWEARPFLAAAGLITRSFFPSSEIGEDSLAVSESFLDGNEEVLASVC